MSAEIGRFAHAAVRSAPLLRPATSSITARLQTSSRVALAASCRHMSSSPSAVTPFRSHWARRSTGTASYNKPFLQQTAPSSSWNGPKSTPGRPAQGAAPATMDREDGSASGSAYDSPFGKDDFDTYEFDDGIELDLPDLSRHPVEAPEDAVARANSVPPKPVMRMVPRTGRTQHVKGGDLARAFQLLSSDITRNQVAREASKQRFHERPGLKRKRVASERWQRKFKGGFKGTLRRVSALVSQGW